MIEKAGFGGWVPRLGFVDSSRSTVSIDMLPVDADRVTLCRAGSERPPVKSACQASLSGGIQSRKRSESL